MTRQLRAVGQFWRRCGRGATHVARRALTHADGGTVHTPGSMLCADCATSLMRSLGWFSTARSVAAAAARQSRGGGRAAAKHCGESASACTGTRAAHFTANKGTGHDANTPHNMKRVPYTGRCGRPGPARATMQIRHLAYSMNHGGRITTRHDTQRCVRACSRAAAPCRLGLADRCGTPMNVATTYHPS